MGEGKKRVAPSLGTAQKQAQLQALPLIKKPIELIGKTIKVPGSFWEGRMTNHVRERAAVCCVHKAALTKIEAASTNFIEIDGETVALHSFREAFK